MRGARAREGGEGGEGGMGSEVSSKLPHEQFLLQMGQSEAVFCRWEADLWWRGRNCFSLIVGFRVQEVY